MIGKIDLLSLVKNGNFPPDKSNLFEQKINAAVNYEELVDAARLIVQECREHQDTEESSFFRIYLKVTTLFPESCGSRKRFRATSNL